MARGVPVGMMLLGVALAYSSLSLVAIYFFSPGGQGSVLFLASGLALATLLMGGPRYVWAVLLGALLSNVLYSGAFLPSVAKATGSALAALLGVWLLRRDPQFDPGLSSIRDFFRLLVWGGFLASLLAATLGVGILVLEGALPPGQFLATAVDWWMGDTLGVVLMAPLMLLWRPSAAHPFQRPGARFLLEAGVIFGVTILMAGLIFLDWDLGWLGAPSGALPDVVKKIYWLFLSVTWVAVRLGARATSLAVLLIAGLGVAGTNQGMGFFIQHDESASLISYWFFMLSLSIVGMTLATYMTVHQNIMKRLAQTEAATSKELENVLAALNRHSIVATVNAAGLTTSVNDNFCAISGYSREELLGRDRRMLSAQRHTGAFFEEFYRVIQSGQHWRGEMCSKAKDGHLFWLQTSISPFMGADGAPTMYVMISTDITDRKQTEIKLAERKAIYRSIVTQARDGIVMIDAQALTFTEFNDAACTTLGYSREEFAQLSLADVQATIPVADMVKRVNALVAAGDMSFDTQYRHKDGSLRDTHVSCRAIWLNEHPYLIGILTDITERKQTELELQRYRENLEELVQQKTAHLQRTEAAHLAMQEQLESMTNLVPGVVFQFLRTTAGGWRVVYISEGVQELFGITVAEVRQNLRVLFDRILALDKDAYRDAIARCSDALLEWEHEYRIFSRGGQVKWVRGQATPSLQVDGSVLWSGILSDITERKRIEDAANDANRAKSEFLANMSHEIRTPMNGVIGMLDILQQTVLQPEQHRMVNTIHNSSLALLSILNDILDYSKIEAGKLALERIPTHLREVAEGVVQLVVSSAAAKSIELSVFVAPELPEWLFCDPARLRQVLLNLVGNAVKFTTPAPGAKGRVSLHVAPGVGSDGAPCVQLRVLDTGIGIREEVLGTLFQPFTQADDSTARLYGGTGLGLSISQRLVEMMGGRISVRSTPGQGSEFKVELPWHVAPAQARTGEGAELPPHLPRLVAPSVEQALAGGRLVLLAEDNETNRDVIQEQLRLLGYAADVAQDGVAALAMWRARPYALLLTDAHMPRMDGFALTDCIRQEEPAGTRMPIVVITANAMPGDAQRCIERGMDDYLPKPLRLQALAAMLAKWLPSPATLDSPAPEAVPDEALAQAASPLAVWDRSVLTQFMGANPAMQARLLSKFLINARGQVGVIGDAGVAGQLAQVAEVAHTLKSAARTVGALALGAQCQQIETAAHAQQGPACQALVGGLAAALDQVQGPIQAYLAEFGEQK